jgi:hypothetical protein
VCTEEKRWVSIDNIAIGDKILYKDGYTKVIGIYIGTITNNSLSSDWLSDGVWINNGSEWKPNKDGLSSDESNNVVYGRFLLTESETLYIKINDDIHLVRDFTEVGASRINECYSWFDDEINKKV